MNASKIESILEKYGVEQSKELSQALEEILTVASKDRELFRNTSRMIKDDKRRFDMARGKNADFNEWPG